MKNTTCGTSVILKAPFFKECTTHPCCPSWFSLEGSLPPLPRNCCLGGRFSLLRSFLSLGGPLPVRLLSLGPRGLSPVLEEVTLSFEGDFSVATKRKTLVKENLVNSISNTIACNNKQFKNSKQTEIN